MFTCFIEVDLRLWVGFYQTQSQERLKIIIEERRLTIFSSGSSGFC